MKVPKVGSERQLPLYIGLYDKIFIITLHIFLGLVNHLINYFRDNYKTYEEKIDLFFKNYLKQRPAIAYQKSKGAAKDLIGPEAKIFIGKYTLHYLCIIIY